MLGSHRMGWRASHTLVRSFIMTLSKEKSLPHFGEILFEGNRIRAKANRLDNNEKLPKYFIKKQKDVNKRLINKLQIDDKVITDFDEIKKEICSFYSDLYKYEEIDDNIANKFLEDLPKLSSMDKNYCEGSISKKECLNSF